MKPELFRKIWPLNIEPPSSAAMHVHTYMAVNSTSYPEAGV